MFSQTSNQTTYMTLSSHESGNRKKCSWAIKLKGLLSMTHFLQLEPPAKGFTDIHQLGTKCSNTRTHVGHLTFKPLHRCFCFFFYFAGIVMRRKGQPPSKKKKKQLYKWTSLVYNFWENIKGNANMPTSLIKCAKFHGYDSCFRILNLCHL